MTAISGVVARLEASTSSILAGYERALQQQGSPLLSTAATRSQILSHARQLLDDLVDELYGRHAETARRTLATELGSSRAEAGIYPGVSLRAAGMLFDVVMCSVDRQAGPQGASAQAMLAVALGMNRVLIRALGAAADSYAALLLDRIHGAHVEERKRISRELHDRVGHGVSLAYRNLELYEIYQAKRPIQARSCVATAQESLRETLDAVRDLISDLRVAEPPDGLEKALRSFLETEPRSRTDVRLHVTGDEHWASPEVRDEVFLIVREALRNVLAHAGADVALVRVQISPGELRATVRDDGQGFQPSAVDSSHAGIVSMRERAGLLGGALSVASSPGQGTTIELLLPLARPTA
ncbi:histidine kinase [Amorphoplanes nipponensis]